MGLVEFDSPGPAVEWWRTVAKKKEGDDVPNVIINYQYCYYKYYCHHRLFIINCNQSNVVFADKGRAQKKGVLVHCLAGISRSVTVMLAYLMAHRQLTLNEAYNMVLKRKANIDPNFHFMQQLHSFEKQLLDARTQPKQLANSTASSASSYLSPLSTAVQSPDSGIEFDRWTPGTGG